MCKIKTNLLFVESSILNSNGGIARVTSVLSSFFSQHDFDVYYMYYYMDDDAVPDNHKMKFDYSWKFENFYSKASRFLIDNNINIVINQDLNFHILIKFYKKIKQDLPNLYVIDCIHNPPNLYKYTVHTFKENFKDILCRILKGYSLYSKMWRDMYDVVDKCVLLSESFLPTAKREYGKNRIDKMTIIPNPLAFETDDILPFNQKKKQFLIVTRLDDHQKNLKSALRIWKSFEGINNDYSLVLAGYGVDEKIILDYAQTLGIQRMNFIGKSTDPRKLYEESRFFMMTSRYEGFGMTLIEAQQCGCIPFVFDSYTALHDIVTTEYDGFIIPNGNEKAYVKKMLWAVGHYKEMQTISLSAHISSRKFAINNIGRKWISLFNALSNY